MQSLNDEECHQVESVKQLLQKIFKDKLYAIYLYGSYVDGGLKHKSDLDILVIIEREITDQERKQLAQNFLNISVPIGHVLARALEITILEKENITNKNHPYTYQLQYGEWLREELLKGELLYSQSDPDISILLKTAQLHNITIFGPDIRDWLNPISHEQLILAMQKTYPQIIAHWQDDQDECNQILALCRMAYTLNHKTIVAKDVAATWFLEFLSQMDQEILQLIIDEYIGQGHEQCWLAIHDRLAKVVKELQHKIEPLLFN